eukprot:m.183733 g.183733  ORF g.183733 m.183733 type:complete len:391 (+) comp18486_c0_seq1:167-1339(+)
MNVLNNVCRSFQRHCALVPRTHGYQCYSTTSVNTSRQVLALDGDGVGAEIVGAAKQVIDAVPKITPIEWVTLTGYGYDNDKPGVTQEHLDAFDEHRVLLKGPITIPAGTNRSNITIGLRDDEPRTFTSPNQAMRKLFSLFANVRPAIKFQLPWKTRFDEVDVNMVIIRENTEDLYCGKPEVWVDDDTCEATKRITRGASKRIAEYAVDLAAQRAAVRGGVVTLTAVHKANVCKQTDGLFLEEVRKAVSAANVAGLTYKEALVDSLCADMVLRPEEFDVLVAPNCWGDIVSDLAGGIVGSLGLLGSSNVGNNHALFEASHGSAPDIAGQGVVNPTSMILSGAMLLRHVGEDGAADAVENAIKATLAAGSATKDLGGALSTSAFTEEVIRRL